MVINRRAFLSTGAAAIACTGAPAFGRAANRPNIVFIMADDLGYADLSCFGRRDFQTPHCDALAAAGTRFTHSYANSPVCSATRLGLITGRYQYRLDAGPEEPIGPPATPACRQPSPLCLGLLRDLGYRTALLGKWHLGNLPDYGPLKSGYDQFWGFRGGGIDYLLHSRSRPVRRSVGRHPPGGGGRLPHHAAGPARRRLRRGAAHSRSALFPQPAFLRAALAVGNAGRRRRGAADHGHAQLPRHRAFRWRQHGDLCRDGAPHGRTGGAAASRPSTVCRRTTRPSSSSPATTEASAFPTSGPLPGAKPSCWKAASACRRSSRWPGVCEGGVEDVTPHMTMD